MDYNFIDIDPIKSCDLGGCSVKGGHALSKPKCTIDIMTPDIDRTVLESGIVGDICNVILRISGLWVSRHLSRKVTYSDWKWHQCRS